VYMKRLIIKNIGPLKEVDIALSKINLIIGPQSTGKSCILKIASFCAWFENEIELGFHNQVNLTKEIIDEHLIDFYNLDGYINESSSFSYHTKTMEFSFSFKNNSSKFEWGEGRWEHKRSKTAYIVAERNVLSVVPNWYELNFPNNSILNFLKEFQNARNYLKGRNALPILNMDVKYNYDKQSGTDKILLKDGKELNLQNVSSGLQSLVPLFVFIDYITDGVFKSDMRSVKDQEISKHLFYQLKKEHPVGKESTDYALMEIVNLFMNYDHSDIYLEEPEENLFPETQIDLVNWLAEILNGERNHTLFIATHSPYIMSAFNNLIQAGDIIEESPEKKAEVEKIIGGNRAIKYDDVAAFAIANGSVHSIKDDELRLMSPSELDTVSDDISNIFNQLLEL